MALLGRNGIRPLRAEDLGAFLRLTLRDPVLDVFAEYRARGTSLDPRWLGAEMWGRYDAGELVAACHVGANLVPVGGTPEDAIAFAQKAAGRERTVSTLVGRHALVEAMWGVLEPVWEAPRDVRWRQPHLEIGTAPLVAPDPRVRLTAPADFDVLYPACVAMYTEEVGVSPEAAAGGEAYRARVRQLMGRGWSFARIDDGELVFKAEIACATPYAAQIQGVYVAPEHRGKGHATAGVAAVVEAVRATIAPRVSLYVNEWNAPARAAYARVGFAETAQFSTIMF
jgi:predicted GNAT family acetyltransferase